MTTRGGSPKQRTVYRLSGVSEPREFWVYNNNLTNVCHGLLGRVFFVKGGGGYVPCPGPTADYGERLGPFATALLSHMDWSAPCTVEEFVQMYQGSRQQRVYALAAEEYKRRGVNKGDAMSPAFTKAEKVEKPCPRMIQPRSPVYNVGVGRYVKRLEKDVYRAIAGTFGEVTVLKGYNGAESGRFLREKWERFQKPVAIGLDASRFDQHVSADALRWEHGVYLKCFKPCYRKELARLLDMQILNRGRVATAEGFVKYQRLGGRMSGDMNTALGNCLLMCALVYTYLREKGVKASLANNGDDCVVIMEQRDLKRFSEGLDAWFLEFGFEMKVEAPVFVFEQIEFCQCHPLWTPEGWVMCRNATKAMAKDSHTVLPCGQGNVRFGWLTAIGECGMALCGGVPMFQEYYQALLRCGKGVHLASHPALESGFARLAAGMRRRVAAVHNDTRVSFWEAFRILPSEQVAIEERLSRICEISETLRRENLEDFSLLQSNF